MKRKFLSHRLGFMLVMDAPNKSLSCDYHCSWLFAWHSILSIALHYDYLLGNGVVKKYVLVLRESYCHCLRSVRVYGQLSPTFVVSNGVRQDCSRSPFIFDFVIEDFLQNASFGPSVGGVGRHLGNEFFDLARRHTLSNNSLVV